MMMEPINLRALIIDDDEDAFVLACDLFSDFVEKKYTLTWIPTYEEASQVMPQNEFDVYLVDYQLGAKNGLELVKEVIQKGCYGPIILLTGQNDHEVDIAAMKAGAADFLVKGQINAPLMERSLRYAMERKRTLEILHHTAAELQTMNEQLKHSEAELRELNANKDKFFSIISHDLKSPFVALLGFSELMANRIESMTREEVVDVAQRMYFSGKNLFKLLENLLQWSRVQTGRMEYQPVKVDLHESVESITTLLSGNALRKKIELRNTIPHNVFATADQNMVNCIFENLVSNAIKYTKPGGSVLVSVREVDANYEIHFQDTGVGIPSKDLINLFRIDQPHSMMGTAEEEGTGLGLILCKELIEKCHGTIGVQSTVGVGTTFTITLPRFQEFIPLEQNDFAHIQILN